MLPVKLTWALKNLEGTLIDYVCSDETITIDKFQFLADLYLATREPEDVAKMYDEMISLALHLNRAKDQIEALVYLQRNYDQLND